MIRGTRPEAGSGCRFRNNQAEGDSLTFATISSGTKSGATADDLQVGEVGVPELARSDGLFDERDEAIIRKLFDGERLLAQIVERDGERHDATFNLASGRRDYDAVARANRLSTPDLGVEVHRSTQAMPNASGHDAGVPDGK